MSARRLKRVCGISLFTIFILGLSRLSLPVLVRGTTTMGDVYMHPDDLELLPSDGRHFLHFNTICGRRTSWHDTMESLGLGPMSHLYLKIPVPGGVDDDGRPKRKRDDPRMQVVLDAEGLDSDGNPVDDQPPKPIKRRKHKPRRKGKDVDTEPEDEDFTGEEGSESDSDAEAQVSNSELAANLPTKKAAASRTLAQPTQSKKKGKAKADLTMQTTTSPSAAAGPSNAAAGPSNTAAGPSNAAAGPSNAADEPSNPAKKIGRYRNPIYHFYEEVDTDADRSKEENARYYKSWLGNRKTLKVTEKSNHNTSKLQSHLEKHFKPHYRLFQVLKDRETLPMPDELQLARGSKVMDDSIAAVYAKKAEQLNKNIKAMFEKQAAVAEEAWDQEHFEDLVARWVAVCDQPFTAVNAPEFREMLQYAHRCQRR
ncbi:hypothetical protein B0H16DRAFT_554505 [Mycena metata]|uniref:Uncharacterized protein n=1 Tax=Mycena metata TaxID=1033252 RepID=A0AAD7MDR1_9AGAR|nr:hypothetical protein B0H16DRAFT_554505 [Mycena metata]